MVYTESLLGGDGLSLPRVELLSVCSEPGLDN